MCFQSRHSVLNVLFCPSFNRIKYVICDDIGPASKGDYKFNMCDFNIKMAITLQATHEH